MKEEILKLYKEYCDEIDNDDLHFTMHDWFKGDFYHFMFWLENGFISWNKSN